MRRARPSPSSRLTRRGVIAAAAALAGTSALLATATPDAAAARRDLSSGGDLVVDGGALLDPATGDVIEDAVVVIKGGVVRAAGSREQVAAHVPADAPVVQAHGRWILPGLVDAHIHLNTAAEARDAVLRGATTARSGSTNFYQDIAVRELARQMPQQAPRLRAAGIFVTPDLGDTILADPDLAPLARLRDGVRSAEALRRVVEVNLARGVDTIKTRVNERAGLPEQDPLVQVYTHEQLSTIVAERAVSQLQREGLPRRGAGRNLLAGTWSIRRRAHAARNAAPGNILHSDAHRDRRTHRLLGPDSG